MSPLAAAYGMRKSSQRQNKVSQKRAIDVEDKVTTIKKKLNKNERVQNPRERKKSFPSFLIGNYNV